MEKSAVPTSRAIVCLLGACGLAAGAAGVQGASAGRFDALQAGPPGAELTLVTTGGGARLVLPSGDPSGDSVPIELPAGALPSAVAALDDGWAVAGSRPGDAGGRRLVFLAGDAEGSRTLPSPPGRRSPVRRDPVLLVDGGRLAGAAWLEGSGEGRFGIRAAAWDGGAWSEPAEVAPPGPGSQLALAGAVLDDGSWLLVWSAFDGGDDEIVWARRVGGSWLPATRLSADNAVPDVVPAVTALAGGGALVAWCRYDGHEYRLRTARFESGEWRDESWAGPGGSLFPSFAGSRERPWLLYRDAGARGWALTELGADGGVASRRLAADSPSARPAVVLGDGSPALVWHGEGGAPALRVEVGTDGSER